MDESKRERKIRNAIKQAKEQNHRLFFIIKDKNAVPTLYDLLAEKFSFLPTLLWCYNKKVKTKKQRKIKQELPPKKMKRVAYQDIDIVLGNTFEMLVLEHFNNITPNIMAKSIETVKGGGIIAIILDSDEHRNFNSRLVKSFFDSSHICILDENLKIESSFNLSDWKADEKRMENSEFENPSCVTTDQDIAVSHLREIMTDRNNKNIALLKASRGRGKSAALGLSISDAIKLKYSIIYVIAPHIENVKTLFEFVICGLKEKNFKENADFEVHKIFKNSSYVKKIVVKKYHRQVIEYHGILDKVDRYPDLLVIDEAAAIPLPILEKLVRANTVLMASTMDGYEGTGRSLSMRFINNLKNSNSGGLHLFSEIELRESIRYGKNDPVEEWLNEILILKTKEYKNRFCPSPEICELFLVNKKTLFSYHKVSETFLKQLISILVSSHYKNSPDDIKVIADEDNHHVFVLLAPENENKLPRILCTAHVAIEGDIEGDSTAGNIIPWKLSEQFLEKRFLKAKGLRIVRMAVHPDYQNMGYGTTMIKSLIEVFENGQSEEISLNSAQPLFMSPGDIKAPKIDWIGASFSLNEKILRFWGRNNFFPVYIKQTLNFGTGAYTAILLRNVNENFENLFFLFRERFINLLGFLWKEFSVELCLTLIKMKENQLENNFRKMTLNDFDMERLQSYADGYSEFNVVYDLIPKISSDYFQNQKSYLSLAQESILLATGCQLKSSEVVARELDITRDQVQIIIKKIVLKFLKNNN